jgi:hypothetical protein
MGRYGYGMRLRAKGKLRLLVCDSDDLTGLLCVSDSQSKPNDSMARQPRVTGDHGGCDWTIDSDGWVHDQDSRLVLWVPPDLRSGLVMPQNTMVMSSQGSIELDFMDARIGDMWQSCYRPL